MEDEEFFEEVDADVIDDDDDEDFNDENFEEFVEIDENNLETLTNDETDEIPINDISKFTFTAHTNSVFSCDLSKDGQMAVTGGQDDCAYLWSTITGDILMEFTGHKDSVTECFFNHDNRLIATGDMSGMIQVWDIVDKKLLWCFEGDDMEWLLWHPMVNVLICGCRSGDIYIWQIPQGNCKVLPSNGSPCTCGRILPDGKRLIAGYGDGHIKLWDIKGTNIIWQSTEFLDISITSIEINDNGTLVGIAPISTILKINDGKKVGTLFLNGENDIETMLFNNELNAFITGSLTGQLCVWDLNRLVIRHQAKIDTSVTIIKAGLNGKVFIGGTDGVIYLCDTRDGSLLETYTGHKSDILSLCVASDGSFILSTSDDGSAKIFTIKK